MSNRIPRDFITHLLVKADIVDVVNERVALKKRGSVFVACCPFHNEKTPSFTVSPSKQIYHCFGCGVGGNALSFLMEFDKLTFVEAVEILAKRLGLALPEAPGRRDAPPQQFHDYEQAYALLERLAAGYQEQLKRTPKALAYIEKRGINQQALHDYGIGYAPPGWHYSETLFQSSPQWRQLGLKAGMLVEKQRGQSYDRFRDRLMFPIRDRRGRVIGFGGRTLENEEPKYLNSPETFIFHKGQEIYGLFEAQKAIREHEQIIVVEGYMDVVALAQFGIKNAVATLGTAATKDHIRLLLRYARNLVFCFDGDAAGRKAAWRALENALAFIHEGLEIGFVFLPEGEDPDTLVRQQSAAAFTLKVKSAMPMSQFLLKHLSEQADITSTDGKVRFTQLAKPLLQQISDPVYKDLLIRKIARLLYIEEARLQEALSDKAQQFASILQPQAHAALSPMRLCIALLLQNPGLLSAAGNPEIPPCNLPGYDLLTEIIEFIKKNPHIHTGTLLEAFCEHPQYNAIKKLACWELYIPETGLINEFTDVIRHLRAQGLEKQMESLLAKANVEGLTQMEREQLQQLIKSRHNVNSP